MTSDWLNSLQEILNGHQQGIVVQADVLALLDGLPQGLFDLVVTSPPYNVGLDYGPTSHDRRPWPDYYAWMQQILTGFHRILKPGGVLALVVAKEVRIPLLEREDHDRKRIEKVGERLDLLCEEIGFLPREAAIWAKGPKGQAIAPVYSMGADNNVYLRSVCEMVLLHSKDRYYYNGGTGKRGPYYVPFLEESKDIWWIPPTSSSHHPCPFPEEIPRRIIEMFTNLKNGFIPLVFDPFVGIGTTAVVAHRLGRRYFVGDINPTYVALARQNLAREKQRLERQGATQLALDLTLSVRGDA